MRHEPRQDASALQPRLPDRLVTSLRHFRATGRRVRAIRRLIAAALVVAAGVLASAAPTSAAEGTAVLVAARDLATGTIVDAGDLSLRVSASPPDGAFGKADRARVVGSLLPGPVRRGEILTDARVVGDHGPDPGPGRAAVPLPLADAAIATLLGPGMHVVLVQLPESRAGDWGAQEGADRTVRVLTADAVVLSLTEPGGGAIASSRSRIAVISVPESVADAVTAAAATQSITIRFGP